jgi:hypothetical protein
MVAMVGEKRFRPSDFQMPALADQVPDRDDLQFTYKNIPQRPNFYRES